MTFPSSNDGAELPNSLKLVGLAVVFLADGNNPSILNPDFLKAHVLDGSWDPVGAPISTPVFAQVTYANGVSFVSEPHRIVIQHNDNDLSSDTVLSAQLALRYLVAVPHVRYTAVGVNPSFVLPIPRQMLSLRNLLRTDLKLKHGHVEPTITINGVYSFPTKQITINMMEAEHQESATEAVMFQCNIHRVVSEGGQSGRIRRIEEIVNACSTDMDEMKEMLHGLNLPIVRTPHA